MTERTDRIKVREALRGDIFAGNYLPRERLVEADLASTYDAPRSVIRAALSDLVADGLVEHERNRGARVREVSVDEAMMVLQVRQRLQALCAELAAENGTADEKARLPELLDQLRVAVDDNDIDELYDANLAIRQLIRTMARQPVATSMLEQLEARNVLRFYPHAIPGRRIDSYIEQQAVMRAILMGDAKSAGAAEMTRMQHAIDTLRPLVEQIGTPDRRRLDAVMGS